MMSARSASHAQLPSEIERDMRINKRNAGSKSEDGPLRRRSLNESRKEDRCEATAARTAGGGAPDRKNVCAEEAQRRDARGARR